MKTRTSTSGFGDRHISTHANPTSICRAISRTAHACVRELKGNRCERRGGGGVLADSSDFGLLEEQSS